MRTKFFTLLLFMTQGAFASQTSDCGRKIAIRLNGVDVDRAFTLARTGSREGIDQLLPLIRQPGYEILRRWGLNHWDAEDVVQEWCYRLIKVLSRNHRPLQSPEAYLRLSLRFVKNDFFRKRRRMPDFYLRALLAGQIVDPSSAIDIALDFHEIWTWIRVTVPSRYLDTFQRRRMDGLTEEEYKVATGTRRGTQKSRLNTADRVLRAVFQSKGYGETD
jgi:DNA-directed RNA polymerase specialized sigma24 family protein